jgi:hypothetical protein
MRRVRLVTRLDGWLLTHRQRRVCFRFNIRTFRFAERGCVRRPRECERRGVWTLEVRAGTSANGTVLGNVGWNVGPEGFRCSGRARECGLTSSQDPVTYVPRGNHAWEARALPTELPPLDAPLFPKSWCRFYAPCAPIRSTSATAVEPDSVGSAPMGIRALRVRANLLNFRPGCSDRSPFGIQSRREILPSRGRVRHPNSAWAACARPPECLHVTGRGKLTCATKHNAESDGTDADALRSAYQRTRVVPIRCAGPPYR